MEAEIKRLALVDFILPKIENKTFVLLRNIFLVLSFTLLTAISAQLKIEIGPVPITGQTFAVLLCGALLGAKRGFLSQFFYLLGGLAGIPWFACGGGISFLVSPSFGYIIGFVLAAFVVGFLCERGFDRRITTAILAMLVGNILIYVSGLLWLARFVGWGKVLAFGLYPFIIGDILKLLLAASILPLGWRLLKRKYSVLFLILFLICTHQSAFSSEEPFYTLEEVKVVSPAKGADLEKISQEVKVVKKEELSEFGLEKVFSALELKERGTFGVQADLSIRGTSFEQNLVVLEGIRISDPQTGHHLMNLPLEEDILESLEILSGGASAIYGPGGFGGAINFNLEPSTKGYKILAEYGSYDYQHIFGNFGFSVFEFPFNLVFSQKKSNGFIWNRDFDIRTFNLYSKDDKKTIFYGFQEKDFGARNFYTTKWNTEWESTKTHLFLVKKNMYKNDWFLEPTLLYRINYDLYLLDRKNPDFYKNTHKSQVFRLNFPLRYERTYIDYLLGVEVSYETLESSRLGDHLRQSTGFYFWLYPKISLRFFPSFGIRYDVITQNKDIFSYNFGFAYLLKDDLKLRSSFNFSYRIPSFTEFYYDSPTIKGNPSLSPEKAYNISVGFDYYKNKINFSGTAFYRYGKDIIDWIKKENIIQAQNIETLKTIGFTLDSNMIFKNFRPFISYTYLNQIAENLPSARYSGSYLRHNFILGVIYNLPWDWEFFGSLNYREYYKRDKVFLVDLKIKKKFDKNITYSFWIKNLLDEDYKEIGEVKAPPQWIGTNLEIRF